MVDTGDLKSPGSNTVGVRVPLRALARKKANLFAFGGTRSEELRSEPALSDEER
jgi:hypothetical protein